MSALFSDDLFKYTYGDGIILWRHGVIDCLSVPAALLSAPCAWLVRCCA